MLQSQIRTCKKGAIHTGQNDIFNFLDWSDYDKALNVTLCQFVDVRVFEQFSNDLGGLLRVAH